VLRRAVIDAFAQPGFHRFWRIYNPMIGFLLFRLYVFFGGNKYRVPATIGVFFVCGVCHDLLVFILFRHLQVVITFAFLLFGIFSLISHYFQSLLQQNRWPPWVNALFNIGLVIVPLYAGVLIDNALRVYLI
jgi:hypothetical protein